VDFIACPSWWFLSFNVCFWVLRRFVVFVKDGVASNFLFGCDLGRGCICCRSSSVELGSGGRWRERRGVWANFPGFAC
jgi:hypothetical protein